jgi:hypothetical protein
MFFDKADSGKRSTRPADPGMPVIPPASPIPSASPIPPASTPIPGRIGKVAGKGRATQMTTFKTFSFGTLHSRHRHLRGPGAVERRGDFEAGPLGKARRPSLLQPVA